MDSYKIDKIINDNQTFLICYLNNNNKINNNFSEKMIIKEEPPEYNLESVKKFYNKYAKYNSYILNNYDKGGFKLIKKRWMLYRPVYQYKYIYIETILKTIFNDLTNLNRFLLIDITYTCEYLNYINNRAKENINKFNIFFKKNNINPLISVVYNPKYNKVRKDEIRGNDRYFFKEISLKNKQDFIYFSGGLEYFLIKSISYYTEQMHYLYFYFQVFYILNFQKKKGSFIINLNYIVDTDVGINLIRLLKKYYQEIFLVRDVDYEFHCLYIVGKNFLGTNKDDMKILKNLFNNIYMKNLYTFKFGESLNVHDKNLRKKNYVIKFIANFTKNIFIHKLIKFDNKDTQFNDIIAEFNNQIIKYLEKKYPNRYKIIKK
jgi:hypothetical protein